MKKLGILLFLFTFTQCKLPITETIDDEEVIVNEYECNDVKYSIVKKGSQFIKVDSSTLEKVILFKN